MTEWGYKASRADLTDFLREISECDCPPDMTFTRRVTELMHVKVSVSKLYCVLSLSAVMAPVCVRTID